MPNHKNRPILVCNVGWMARYQGDRNQPDKIVGGGKYVDENHTGHECCNFLATEDGRVFGHFETIKGENDRQVNLERLGAPTGAEKLQHVDVVWVATLPKQGGRRVVGYYLDATVYRKRQLHAKSPTGQHRADDIGSYMVTARSSHVVLIPLKERNIQLGRGPGWIGQASWWYPETSTHADVPAFLKQVRELLDGARNDTANSNSSRKWGGPTDPERNALVEKTAVAVVEAHFSDHIVKSVEKDNCGWDLEVYANAAACRKHKPSFVIEVKGLTSEHLQVGVTPNEYGALKKHMAGHLPHYRLSVVTGALSSKPVLHVLHYEGPETGWFDKISQDNAPLDVEEKTAAIISLIKSR